MTDLSRKVAEVMGWKESVPPCSDNCWKEGCQLFNTHECNGERWFTEQSPPEYAHDLNLAMSLVKEDGSWLELTTGELERDVCHALVWIEFDSGQAEHKEPATAICLAWLEAKEAGLRALGEE